MAKQIKIGFDKTISPKINNVEPLYDLTGLPLRNENGEPLYTEELGPIEAFYSSKKALPIVVNNPPKKAIKVVEQFPETSQVSSTLLGVNREEQQLGLFSDVSVYGFNNNIWEFVINPEYPMPIEWRRRRNKLYGNRSTVRAEEISEEQAIALKAFPVPWSFPYGPNFAEQGLYNPVLYEQYARFINLGQILYEQTIASGDPELETFAKDNFLLPGLVEVIDGVVIYNQNKTSDEIFADIEKWTMSWIAIRNGTLFYPNNTKVVFPDGYSSSNTRPGYSSNLRYYGQIESRKAFRYQPGRISGFTFGLRCSSDQASLDNVIEWGAANDTDQYVFQVKGPNFSIVRRSTIPLPEKNLIDMGLTAADQKLVDQANYLYATIYDPTTGNVIPPKKLYETVITRDFFNNDKLDGNGPSGYILTVEQVTMYKIEFSWYGAIGAKFYAYVPSENDECRWVLMHTLIIENKIGKPCLNDPYFKFRYSMNIVDTSNLVAPQFVYKYGASYYIDGGDEGSSVSYSTVSDEVASSPIFTRSAIGLYPKNFLLNSDGIPIKNKKDIIPELASITTTEPVRVDIIDCEGCPGFGHHYAPSIRSGQIGKTGEITISPSGTYFYFTDGTLFEPEDVNKKLVGDGIYSTYIDRLSPDLSLAYVKRKLRIVNPIDPKPISTSTFANSTFTVLSNGSLRQLKGGTFNVRLTGYDTIIASSLELTKPNIAINFLNPGSFDGRSFADYFIGVTDKAPSIDLLNNKILFNGNDFNINDVLYSEWTNFRLYSDYNGYDLIESDERYGYAMEIDPQIPNPPGVDSGRCSKINVTVSEFELPCSTATITPGSGSSGTLPNNKPGNYLVFNVSDASILDSLNGLKGGQIGVPDGDSFVASQTTFVDDKATRFDLQSGSRYYIEVSDNNLQQQGVNRVAFKVVRIYARYINKTKVFSYDLFPLFLVIGMRDNIKINNLTVEEFDSVSKFSYTPEWLIPPGSSASIINSGNNIESLDPNNGVFRSGGVSIPGEPPTNYLEVDRLSSAVIDKQLQQPLRPGEIRSTLFLGKDETKKLELNYLFGQDRYVITPGLYNTRATFFTAKALQNPGKVQVTVNYKEQ